jgi:hypothetical protein
MAFADVSTLQVLLTGYKQEQVQLGLGQSCTAEAVLPRATVLHRHAIDGTD